MPDQPNDEELSDRLSLHLRDEAELIPTLPTGVAATDRIERRAVRAQRRRTALVGAAMAISVAGVGAGAMVASAPTNELISADQVSDTADDALAPEPDPDENAAALDADSTAEADPSGTSDGTLEPPTLISDGPAMGWTEVVVPSADFLDVFVHDGLFMAVALAGDESTALWSSADGVDWSERPVPVSGQNWSAMSAGDAIVLTSFVPAEDIDEPGFEETWFSTDLGESWTALDLPDVAPGGPSGFTMVAAIGDIAVASVTLDDPEGGIPSTVALYRSVGGGPFEPVDLGQLELGEFAELGVVRDSFQLTIYDGIERRFVSADGETWTGAPSQDGFRQVVQGGDADQLALSYSSEFPSLERSSDGGATWQEPFEIDQLLVVGAAFNDDGYVLAVQTGVEDFTEPPMLTIEPSLTKGDLEINVEVDFAQITVIDLTTGDEIFRTELDDSGEGEGLTYDEEADVVTITDPSTGELIVTFTGEEFAAANEDEFSSVDSFSSGVQLGFTVDGERYGWQTVEEAFGVEAGWVDIDSNGDIILATVFSDSGPTLFAATGPTG